MAFLPLIGELILAASGATFATAAAASATAAVVGTAAVASTVYGVKSMLDSKSSAAGAPPPAIAPPTPGTTALSPSSQQASLGLRQQQARQRGIKSTMLAGDTYQGVGGMRGGETGTGKKLGG